MNEYDYIIDAFTRDGNNTNLEVDNLHVGCITSKNNNFEIDSQGNLTIQSINTNSIPTLVDYFYPVNSVYISLSSINPGTIFGGTWEQLKDKFLLGAGDTYTAGSTGGTNRVKQRTAGGNLGLLANGFYAGEPVLISNNSYYSIMPPYLTVYMWRRVS